MTVAQLITKLQGLSQNALVLTDMPCNIENAVARPQDSMNSPLVVAQGNAYLIVNERSGSNFYVGSNPYLYTQCGPEPAYVFSVYIGTGDGIVGPAWTTV